MLRRRKSSNHLRSSRGRRKLVIGLIFLIIIGVVVAVILVQRDYNDNLKPVSNDQRTQLVTIPSGSSVQAIASELKKAGLIRSTLSFEEYVSSQNLRSDLQAGTYALSPSQDVQDIVSIITKGKVATNLVTILPGRRLDQVKADLINSGFSPDSVDQALQPTQYQDLPIFAFVPAGSSLEGLLYPDSFQRNADTDPSVIIRESLTEMGQHITPDLQQAFVQEGLTVYKGITLASIIEQEVPDANDQSKAAQVFLSRLAANMNLESDATARYGAIVANQPSTINFNNYDSPYNTYLHSGLPPGPIASVNEQALQSAAHPASTNFLYFVTGKDNVTYFAQTQDQQNANIAQHGVAGQ